MVQRSGLGNRLKLDARKHRKKSGFCHNIAMFQIFGDVEVVGFPLQNVALW